MCGKIHVSGSWGYHIIMGWIDIFYEGDRDRGGMTEKKARYKAIDWGFIPSIGKWSNRSIYELHTKKVVYIYLSIFTCLCAAWTKYTSETGTQNDRSDFWVQRPGQNGRVFTNVIVRWIFWMNYSYLILLKFVLRCQMGAFWLQWHC